LPFGAAGFVACNSAPASFQDELAKLRPQEAALRAQWTREEQGGLKKLPPRAWPLYQPKAEEIESLRARLEAERCPPVGSTMSPVCTKTNFDLATALVFNDEDAPTGLTIYQGLGKTGNLDGMVATGVVLVEGLGVTRDEKEGLRWLRQAVDQGSAQGSFEVGTLLFMGGANLQEDEAAGFKLFEQAAAQKHAAGMFMVADCLLEGAGCGENADKARAVPLLHAAAVQGHRGARQYLRMLWDGKWTSFA